MGIFCGFGNAELGFARLADGFAHGHGQFLWGKRNRHIGHGGVIFGHADKMQGQHAAVSLESRKLGIDKGAGYLAGAVGTEVEENETVARLYRLAALYYGGHDKLVCGVFALGVQGAIGFFNRLYGVGRLQTLTVYHGGIGLIYPPPLTVAVHAVIAAHHRGDGSRVNLR